jgi:molecular chaperone DnaK (HSP70)
MADEEELVDCVMAVDETLSEVEEALEEKNYSTALRKLREAREAINELRSDDESEEDHQEADMNVAKKLT